MIFRNHSIFWATLLLGIAGCGGNTPGVEYPAQIGPQGEGNIPIGRAQGQQVGESMVKIEMSDGRVYNTITKKQVVYSPLVPQGLTKVTIVPGNRLYSTYEFSYITGHDQQWAFNINPADRLSPWMLRDLQVNLHPGEIFKVGEEFIIKGRPIGLKLDKFKLNIIVSGGIAHVTENGGLVFTSAGMGQVNVELLGVTKVFDIVVVPK